MSSTPDLSVVICSRNGGPGVDRCLRALGEQQLDGVMETIVVDDGSTDDTSAVALRHGARLVRHEVNRGLAAARNSGVRAASSEIVAFLDDDCEPQPGWAQPLLSTYGGGVIGVGGPVVPSSEGGFMAGYLKRHNPLEPLEVELAHSEALHYRIRLYVRRLWSTQAKARRRAVFSLVGANMSFRRDALMAVGLFDERFRFGSEELDLCRRLAHAYPLDGFVFQPEARVVHHFESSLSDSMRRSRAYGRGSARMFRKWPGSRPTFFPFPLAMAGLLGLAAKRPRLLALAVTVPHLMYPAGAREALRSRSPASLLDPYVELIEEGYGDVGFLEGLWMFRHFEREPAEPGPRADAVEAESSPPATSLAS